MFSLFFQITVYYFRVDNFWPWIKNKAEATTTYYGKQHFRDVAGGNIAAPRDGVPNDVNDAATDTINNDEASAIPNTVGKSHQIAFYWSQKIFNLFFIVSYPPIRHA